MKTSTQLKALLRNLSKKSSIGSEILLRNFMLERFLERVSISEHRNNFENRVGIYLSELD